MTLFYLDTCWRQATDEKLSHPTRVEGAFQLLNGLVVLGFWMIQTQTCSKKKILEMLLVITWFILFSFGIWWFWLVATVKGGQANVVQYYVVMWYSARHGIMARILGLDIFHS